MAKKQSGDDAGAGEPATWRELAVARSLDSARTRAENRVQRFLDAALELIQTGDNNEFTVQEVVERSGQSLRSFYQYFDGKYELLLALFEESVRTTAEQLGELVAPETDPLERLHRFVVEYYKLCRPVPKGKATSKSPAPTPVLVEFAQQLLTDHPAEAARAFVPIVSLFEDIVGKASDAGAIRADIDHRQIAGVVLESIMFNAFSFTIVGASMPKRPGDAAEGLWDLLFHGLAAAR